MAAPPLVPARRHTDARLACRRPTIELIERGERTDRAARRAMRKPGELLPSLQQLRDGLASVSNDRPS